MSKIKHRIHVEGIKLYAYHGCLAEEAKIGGNYIVDVALDYDFSKAAVSDDLSNTVDYCEVYEICKKEMAIRSKLIEQVCHRISKSIQSKFPMVTSLKVKVTKISPPMNGDVSHVSVEIEG